MNDDLRQISDGRLYGLNDMVKVGCHDCAGCSDCCRDMGESIVLDPYDIFRLTKHLGKTFGELLAGPVELHVEDGLILPNLKMQGNGTPSCSFLSAEGCCTIHDFRPGLCRLFPLGRNYDGDWLNYFLLVDACPVSNKSKRKVSRWLETERVRDYEKFLVAWHDLTKRLRTALTAYVTEEGAKDLNMRFLQIFYLRPYESEDFYAEFRERLAEGRSSLL